LWVITCCAERIVPKKSDKPAATKPQTNKKRGRESLWALFLFWQEKIRVDRAGFVVCKDRKKIIPKFAGVKGDPRVEKLI